MSTKHSSIVPSLFVLLSVWVAGCADAGYSSLSEERVQVQLCARDGVLSRASDAGNLPEQEFEATVALSTAKGDYASLSEACEGTWNAAVKTDGKMEWKTAGGSDVPVYPSSGDWLYLTAFSPTAVPSGGVASFVLTGQTDLLYAPNFGETSGKASALPGTDGNRTVRCSSVICSPSSASKPARLSLTE